MRKNVIFVFVFAAVIWGLVQLHTKSLEDSKDGSFNVKGIAVVSYPSSVEERNNIPFELLINPADKALLPDSTDYEKFRPNLILLEKGFNEKDSVQLKEFPNIVVNAVTIDSFDASILETEYAVSLAKAINSIIYQNADRTSSSVSDLKELPISQINGAKVLRFEYRLESQNRKILNIIVSYLFKNDKQVEVTLTSPDKDLKKWTSIYNEVLNNISID
uniref:hypothetical protein n=1 Tax=uncultured Dysgonomonas sp. TaxID=206096 RepID=UPI0026126816|nr:hypothetical protein [uncultured Dysgonomonas sp.]